MYCGRWINVLLLVQLILLCSGTMTMAKLFNFPLKRTKKMTNEAVKNRESQAYEGELAGKPGLGYYIQIGVGTPAQNVNVLVDTGSSNLAVAANPHPFVDYFFDPKQSSTFINLGRDVEVPYTQGVWRADLGSDKIHLTTSSHDLVVTAEISAIYHSDGFFINGSRWQGILGLGYKGIAQPDSSVVPYFDTLVEETNVTDSFSLQLCGTLESNTSHEDISIGGTMTIGGVDDSLYRGDIQYVPVQKEWYYEVVLTDIQVSGTSLGLDCKEYNFDKTIVDSGTTNLRLPLKVYSRVVTYIKQNTQLAYPVTDDFWDREDILCWEEGLAPWGAFPKITLTLLQSVNTTVDLVIAPQQYLRPVDDEYNDEGFDDCYKFAIDSSTTGTVIGAVIMEGFYVIFDRENKRVGFAETTCPRRSGTEPSQVGQPQLTQKDLYDCAYKRPVSRTSSLMMAAYIMAGLCGVCVIPLLIMVAQWLYIHTCKPAYRPSDQQGTDINNLLPETNENIDEDVMRSVR